MFVIGYCTWLYWLGLEWLCWPQHARWIYLSYPKTHGKTGSKYKYLLYVAALVASSLYLMLFSYIVSWFISLFGFLFFSFINIIIIIIIIIFTLNSVMLFYNLQYIIYLLFYVIHAIKSILRESFYISLFLLFSSLSPSLSFFVNVCVICLLSFIRWFCIPHPKHFYYL